MVDIRERNAQLLTHRFKKIPRMGRHVSAVPVDGGYDVHNSEVDHNLGGAIGLIGSVLSYNGKDDTRNIDHAKYLMQREGNVIHIPENATQRFLTRLRYKELFGNLAVSICGSKDGKKWDVILSPKIDQRDIIAMFSIENAICEYNPDYRALSFPIEQNNNLVHGHHRAGLQTLDALRLALSEIKYGSFGRDYSVDVDVACHYSRTTARLQNGFDLKGFKVAMNFDGYVEDISAVFLPAVAHRLACSPNQLSFIASEFDREKSGSVFVPSHVLWDTSGSVKSRPDRNKECDRLILRHGSTPLNECYIA